MGGRVRAQGVPHWKGSPRVLRGVRVRGGPCAVPPPPDGSTGGRPPRGLAVPVVGGGAFGAVSSPRPGLFPAARQSGSSFPPPRASPVLPPPPPTPGPQFPQAGSPHGRGARRTPGGSVGRTRVGCGSGPGALPSSPSSSVGGEAERWGPGGVGGHEGGGGAAAPVGAQRWLRVLSSEVRQRGVGARLCRGQSRAIAAFLLPFLIGKKKKIPRQWLDLSLVEISSWPSEPPLFSSFSTSTKAKSSPVPEKRASGFSLHLFPAAFPWPGHLSSSRTGPAPQPRLLEALLPVGFILVFSPWYCIVLGNHLNCREV